jgi:glutathione synthase/RimK-type ligase-like ATP-grasp enzyme
VVQLLSGALVERGHDARVLSDPRQLATDARFDVAMWRPDSRNAAVAAFAKQAAIVLDGLGTPFVNDLRSMDRAASKFVTHLLFARASVPGPETWLAPRATDSAHGIPDGPLIVKPVWGKRAGGVALCTSLDDARAHVERLGRPCLFQRPIAWRYQHRCVVTRERVVRVYRQENPDPSSPVILRFDRHNPSAVADVPAAVSTMALAMIAAVGGDLMRSDLLEDAGGALWALEVNASFGFPHGDHAVVDAFLAEFERRALA